jgi:hypothetical protein
MGMFDTVLCRVPLPDGYDGADFQTKAFDCELETYVIDGDGTLWREQNQWWKGDWGHDAENTPEGPRERVMFHGVLRFYDLDERNHAWSRPYDPTTWHEYDAKFTDGVLVEIVQVPPVDLTPA